MMIAEFPGKISYILLWVKEFFRKKFSVIVFNFLFIYLQILKVLLLITISANLLSNRLSRCKLAKDF